MTAREALALLENELIHIEGVAACIPLIIAGDELLRDHGLTREALQYLSGRLVAHHNNAEKAYHEVFEAAVKVLR
jgi:hypothetical protein